MESDERLRAVIAHAEAIMQAWSWAPGEPVYRAALELRRVAEGLRPVEA